MFDRDAATRRSKARADLKAKTSKSGYGPFHALADITAPDWTDEQIEGWRIMLERNVRFGAVIFEVTLTDCVLLATQK